MQRGPIIAGSLTAIALAGGIAMAERGKDDPPPVEVVFGESDGIPETLEEFETYKAAFVVTWSGGPVSMRDGVVSVFASRQGAVTEDAPDDRWPLVCESEFDDIVNTTLLLCEFEAPGAGEFALLLEVRSITHDTVIGEGIYTHLVIDPDAESGDGG